MTLNHLVTKSIKKRKVIPLCIVSDCGYVRLQVKEGEVWTDDYNHKKLVRDGYVYPHLTGTVCPYHLNEYHENKKFKKTI